MNEAAFSTQVYDLLNLYHWVWTHFRPGRSAKGWRTAIAGHAGFPDIVAVRYGRLLFIELKGVGGHMTPEQEEWKKSLEIAAEVGVAIEYHLWYPDRPGPERMAEILR